MIVINSLGQIKQPVGGGAAATAISGIGASNSTYTSGTVIFSNQANITIGTSVDGASQYVRLSAGAGGGGGAALSAGTQSVNTGTVLFADSNGLTFGMSGSSRITGSYTVPSTAGLISYVNLSAGATSNNSSAFTFADSNGISFGLNAGTITGTVKTNYLTSQSNQNVIAGNGGFAFQTLSFSDANAFSFGTSAGSAITGSYTVPTVTNSSWTVSDAATSGTVARLAFTNQNGITLSLSTGAGGSHTIVGSHNALTSQSNPALSGSNGSFSFQTATFGNLNGLSFYTSNGSMVGSYTVPTQTNQTVGEYAVQNTTGQSSSSTWDARSLSFAGLGIVSVGQSAGSGLLISATQSNQAASASNGSFAFQTLNFSNANNVTFGTSAGSIITASVSPPGGAAITQSVGISNVTAGGSTAGTTGMVTGDDIQYVLVPGSNITMSQSINGSSGTLSIYAPAGGGGATLSQWAPFWHGASGMLTTQWPGDGSIMVFPSPPIEAQYSFSRFVMSVSASISSSSNSSHGGTLSIGIGFYTRNSSTLSLATSGLGTYAWTNTSNNSTGSLSGIRQVTGSFANMNLTPGDYWIAFWSKTSTVNANWFTMSNVVLATGQSQSAHSGDFATASAAASFQPGIYGHGTYSATSNVLPVSMAFSHITGSIRWYFRPHLSFVNFTQ